VIATNIRRLGVYLMLSFGLVTISLSWWQVVDAAALNARPDNPEVIAARLSLPRGSIFDANGVLLASSQVIDGISTRTYADPDFTHVIGYASPRFGTTGVERAFEDVLTGQSDPNPIRDIVSDVLDRPPEPRDLTLTLDARLQDFAAAQLAGSPGAVVALDPRTGAILAIVSVPTFDATPISGAPATAQEPMDLLRHDPSEPLLARATQGRYVPGSIMKVVTAAVGLETGAITPSTTFPDQPQEEAEGFTVSGFTITEHDLGGVPPALWPLSEALQVSSNIYFAHVALEVGAERYLQAARRFGFCDPIPIGPDGRAIRAEPSLITNLVDGECSPFDDDVELAVSGFGQSEWFVTPLQMALVAATIANDGLMQRPWVVADVRAHVDGTTRGESVVDRFGPPAATQVVSGQTAGAVRTAMVDAVNGTLGRPYAGQGDVTLYGIGDALSAGKTGTAQLGGEAAPHSWFVGFAPAQEGVEPAIAVAVLVESGGAGSANAAPIGGRVLAEWLRLTRGGG
jgi:peptidoglycan glycosyltransferase